MKTYKQKEREKHKQSLEIVSKGFRSPNKLRLAERERVRVRANMPIIEDHWWLDTLEPERIILKECDKSQFKVGDICLLKRSWYMPGDFSNRERVTVTGFLKNRNCLVDENGDIIQSYSIICVDEGRLNYTANEEQLTKIIKKVLSPEALATINEIDPYGEDIWDE